MIKEIVMKTIVAVMFTMLSIPAFAFEGSSYKKTVEAESEAPSAYSARLRAQEIRDKLIQTERETCLEVAGARFDVSNKWTTHRKSGFKFKGQSGALVSCIFGVEFN